jgi:hypothetical protein
MSAQARLSVLWVQPNAIAQLGIRPAAVSFNCGDRVMAAVHTDTWARGDRFGKLEKITQYRGKTTLHVRMDRSGRLVRFSCDNLISEEELGL